MAGIGTASYTRVRSRARDSQRKQDLKAIQTGLEQYFLINADFPVDGGNAASAGYIGIAGIDDGGTDVATQSPGVDIYNKLVVTNRYVEKWPKPPQLGLVKAYFYKYFAKATLSTTTEAGYKLKAALETDTNAMENDGGDCSDYYELYSSGAADQAC